LALLGQHLVKRVEKLREAVFAENAEAAVVSRPANVAYFTGYDAGVLLALRSGEVLLLVPPLLRRQALDVVAENGLAGSVEVVVYTSRPDIFHLEGRVVKARGVVDALNTLLPEGLILYDSLGLESAEKLGAGSRRRFKRISVEKWRAVKEWWELELMKRAIEATEKGFRFMVDEIQEGYLLSEVEAAAALEYGMRMGGAEDYAFPSIIAFGANTVYPHAKPSPRRYLRLNTPVVIDAGARVGGYCSDMTRSFMYPSPSPDYRAIIEALVDAINAALERLEPGVKASAVDEAARRELEKHGLAKYFIHSLGHGVGLEVHEYPRLGPASSDVVEEGMVVTIEPGVYIESQGLGARLEEMVLVTARGPRVLTGLPLDLFS